jgi:exosome complex exonuclease RRP6
MAYYARSDTHYLLYIYDRVRNELIKSSDRSRPETDYIGIVLQKSTDLSLTRYQPGKFDRETGDGARGWYSMLAKNPSNLSGPQFSVFKAVWEWRDEIARTEDESTVYVMPNNVIVQIANVLPPDAKALHSLLPSSCHVPRRNLQGLWDVVREGRERGETEPTYLQWITRLMVSKPTEKKVENSKREAPASSVQESAFAIETRQLDKTQLFGDMAISTKWEQPKSAPRPDQDYIDLPWRSLVKDTRFTVAQATDETTSEILTGADKMVLDLESGGGARLGVSNDEFTLKAGVKRKAEPEERESTVSGNEVGSSSEAGELISLPGGENDGASEAERSEKVHSANDQGDKVDSMSQEDMDEMVQRIDMKKKRKEKKRGEISRKDAETTDEAPFDYSKASSVLHASRAANIDGGGGAKTFDPYSKVGEDGPKAARKAPPQHGGRTATFKK